MTTFDSDLVGRWFSLLLDQDAAARAWGVRPTDAERAVLVDGGRAVAAAVGWSALPPAPTVPRDPAAAALQAYLIGMATGVAGTRAAMVDNGDLDGVAVADRLCLVAGLIAGGAALQVADVAGAARPGSGAADLARVAGTSAAELVVDGADLRAITNAAAAAALVTGPPDGANREPAYRARAMVSLVLMALQRSTAPSPAPVAPPSCGAGPGVNNGTELLAEITFTAFLDEPALHRLCTTVRGLAEELVVWSEGDRRHFHVHSFSAGEVIAEAYAVGSVFSLEIGRL